MTADPLDKIRGQLLAGIDEEPGRRKRRRAGIAASAVVVVLGAAALAVGAPWQDGSDEVVAGRGATDATVPDAPTAAESPDAAVWSIAQPPGWDRAGRELMPNLGWDSLTLASFDLRPGGERCAQFPEQALRDMGADDVLVTVLFPASTARFAAPWPEGGDLADALPVEENHDALECADRDELRIHGGEGTRAGVGMTVLVAFGPDVSAERTEITWRALSSLGPRDQVDRAKPPVCVVSVPIGVEATLPTPPGYDTPTPGHAWHGTADLWTPLEIDGSHARRKSIWFSQHFLGGDLEPEPDISVTWRRLDDRDAAPITAGSPGTTLHGFGTDPGGPMLAGIDPEEPGCWEVTATYRGHELSYVYWNPDERPDDRAPLEETASDDRSGYGPRWEHLAGSPVLDGQDGAPAVVWVASRFFVWGGGGDHASTYVPNGPTEPIAESPIPLRSAPAAVAFGDSVFVWGGFDADGPRSDGAIYDTGEDRWEELPPAPLPPGTPLAAVDSGGEILVFGHRDRSGTEEDLVRGAAFDPSTRQWRALPDAPVPVNSGNGVWAGSELVVLASRLDTNNAGPAPTAMAYSPEADEWRTLPSPDVAPQSTWLISVDDRLYAWDYLLDAAVLDLNDPGAEWRSLPPIPLDDRECYISGGVSSGRVLATYCAEGALLDTDENRWTAIPVPPGREPIMTDVGAVVFDDEGAWRLREG